MTALREFATTQIADCAQVRSRSWPRRCVTLVAAAAQLCGPAVTVWTKPGDILYVLKAVDSIVGGDDAGGLTAACKLDAAVIGDIAGQALADRGGGDEVVVDGAVRDLDGLDAVGLPTFALGAHPATGSNQGPGAINVVVQCGGVTVRPGDVVRGDASGLVVVPTEHLARVLALTQDGRQSREEEVAAGHRPRHEPLPAATGIDDLIQQACCGPGPRQGADRPNGPAPATRAARPGS